MSSDTNNVLTQEERRTWGESAHAAGRFAVSAFKHVANRGKRQFPASDDFSHLPRPVFQPKESAKLGNYIHDAPTRAESLAQLLEASDPHNPLDVLIIGGGATGTGIALDLATRAVYTGQLARENKQSSDEPSASSSRVFAVGLVEANDFASETSSRSSKLIHGGVRYLEKAVFGLDFQQLKLVFEALSERIILAHQAPFLVHPIETIIPCYSLYDAVLFWVGMKTYDLLAVLGGGVVGGYSGFHFGAQTRMYYPHLMGQRDFSLSSSTASKDTFKFAFFRDALSIVWSILMFASYPIMLVCSLTASLGRSVMGAVCSALSSQNLSCLCSSILSTVYSVPAFLWSVISSSRLLGAVTYFDGQHHDARLCLHVAITAGTYGAACVNHCRLIGIKTIVPAGSATAAGRAAASSQNEMDTQPRDVIHECKIWDSITNKEHTIYAKAIVNATGPFSDSIRKLVDANHSNRVRPSHGTHITLPSRFAPKDRAMLIPSNDGRVIFCISYLGHCIAGTTDAMSKVEESPRAPEKDVEFILNNLRPHLGPIDRSEVLSVWCGIRPLAAPEVATDGSTASTQSIVREHSIHADVKHNILSITGGKWTTYRKMAHDAVVVMIDKGMVDKRRLMWNCANDSGKNIPQALLLDDSQSLTANMVLYGAHNLNQYTTSATTLAYTAALNKDMQSRNTQNGSEAVVNKDIFSLPYREATNKLASAHKMPVWVVLHWIQTYGDKVEVLIKMAKEEIEHRRANGQYTAASKESSEEGAVSFDPKGEDFGLADASEAAFWKNTFRICPSLPTVTTDVRYSTRYESCEKIQDFVARRSALAFLSVEETKQFAISKVADIMAEEKEWTSKRKDAEIADALAYLGTFVARP